MNSKISKLNKKHLQNLVIASKEIALRSLAEAAVTDAVDLFPKKTLKEIEHADLLTAAMPSKFGGQNLGLIPGTNFALLTILKHIGSGNLVMGRVLEGHINAQILINQFGKKSQIKRYAEDASEGKLFGVWNTQAADGTFLSLKKGEYYGLNGSKSFATGTDYVSRPIVTAALPDGTWQMSVVHFDKETTTIDANWWHPMGMRASRSYKLKFNDTKITKENILGKPGAYYEQPGFSGGAVRFAAVQLGAAERLLDETRIYLCSLGRTEDPYQKMRVGQMAIAVESGNQWLTGAAQHLDYFMLHSIKENSERLLAFANMMRTAIEAICTEVMALCQKCVGARGLNKPYHFGRIIRDLNTYLRQPAPDFTLADVGRHVLHTDISASELWELSPQPKRKTK